MAMRPWLVVRGVMYLIMAAVSVAGAAAVLARGAAPGVLFGVMIRVGILLAFGVMILKFASSISQYYQARSTAHLDNALNAHLGYWRLWGIVAIVFLSLVAVGILLVLLSLMFR